MAPPCRVKDSLRSTAIAFRYVFGPVRSGRLGLSLGLDLLGERICSFDCLYCESGPTSQLTVDRRPYVPARAILDELLAYREQGEAPEYVTLGGLGEPCLNSDLAEIIAGAKAIYPGVPVAVLTNSSLLHLPEVRHDLRQADAVLPSMDSLVQGEMRRLNRPHKSLDTDVIRQGLLDFRQSFTGRIFLEILLATGYNDSVENLELLRQFQRELRPDRVDVCTLTRPGASRLAQPVEAGTLTLWRNALQAISYISVPVTGDTPSDGLRENFIPDSEAEATILGSLRRRPQTAAQLSRALSVAPGQVEAILGRLVDSGALRETEQGGEPFYFITGQNA